MILVNILIQLKNAHVFTRPARYQSRSGVFDVNDDFLRGALSR